jgi:hypothetical protein
MSFFEPPPPHEEPEWHPQPDWAQSPDNQLGTSVPLRLLLVRTPSLALLVDQFVTYTTGFSFRLAGRSRLGAQLADRRRFETVFGPAQGDMTGLLLGIEFANGRKATNLRHGPTQDDDPGPVLMGAGGGAGGGRFDLGFWVWPLPPDGPLAFAVQWTAQGIELTRAEVEASPLRAAGALSEPLWPERDRGGGGGWTSSEMRFGEAPSR